MKLWDKGKSLNRKIEAFTTEKDRKLDLYLAKWDILGSIAHATMLAKIGLLTEVESKQLVGELRSILKDHIEKGTFSIEEGVEDVHSQVELMLTQKLGDVGKKIHSGRSRNDQVLVDLKLYFRHELSVLTGMIHTLFLTLLEKSDLYKNIVMPGYTHMQVAMPSSFGLWFSSYAESLAEDLLLVQAAYRMADQNPLGSAAGYGSNFPLDRKFTTRLLGFEDLSYNSVTAQMGRGKTEKIVAIAIQSVASTLSKLSMDICLYNGQNFNFFQLPDDFTTGSSIMPHKKNPDVFELIRGRCNQLQALPFTISQVIGNLPSGYHRDLQVTKEEIIPALESIKSCLDLLNFAITEIKVNDNLIEDEKYRYMFTVENVNEKVKMGVPFRDAYKSIGKQVEDGSYQPLKSINHTHEGSIGNLCLKEIDDKFNKIMSEMRFERAFEALEGLQKGNS